jgi:hypothetical protein
VKFPKGGADRTRVLPGEMQACETLRAADRAGKLVFAVDVKKYNHQESPVFSEVDVFLVPLILWTSSITLLFTFGMGVWVVDVAFVLAWQIWGQPRFVAWRLTLRTRKALFLRPENLKLLWKMGFMGFALKSDPEKRCVAPGGDWRLFVADYLLEPEAIDPAATPAPIVVGAPIIEAPSPIKAPEPIAEPAAQAAGG